MSHSAPIKKYREHLAPLLASFRIEPRIQNRAPNPEDTFTDQFGNFIEFSHTEPLCCCPPLLRLLKNLSLGSVEVQDVDKGHLSYSVYKHADSYYIVYESRVDLYGWCGNFTSYVVVPTLEPLMEFMEKLNKESEDDNE